MIETINTGIFIVTMLALLRYASIAPASGGHRTGGKRLTESEKRAILEQVMKELVQKSQKGKRYE